VDSAREAIAWAWQHGIMTDDASDEDAAPEETSNA
jgi:hypothetical protein